MIIKSKVKNFSSPAFCRWEEKYRATGKIDKELLSSFQSRDWGVAFWNYPEILPFVNWKKLRGFRHIRLLHQAGYIDRCNWLKLNGLEWACFLAFKPEYAEKCDWSKLKGPHWCCLLKRHPEFADKCDWSTLSHFDWANLLRRQPQLAKFCDKWADFQEVDWVLILRKQPQLAPFCNWQKIRLCRKELLKLHPELQKYCDVCPKTETEYPDKK